MKSPRKIAVPGGTVTPRKPVPPRLPDSSTFVLLYCEPTETWQGSLTVRGVTHTAKARAVFTLLSKLDETYRRSVRKGVAP